MSTPTTRAPFGFTRSSALPSPATGSIRFPGSRCIACYGSLRFLVDHDLFEKPGPTFSDQAPTQMGLNRPNSSALKLQLCEPRIKAAGGDERMMRPLLDDAALMQHQNAVAGQDCRQPMRDHDGG